MRALLVLLFLVLPSAPAVAQAPAHTTGTVQVGGGILPGIGGQAGYISPGAFISVEYIGYVDYTPNFVGGESVIQVAVGAGGAVRVLGIARLFGEERNVGSDFDIGLRIGPALSFFTGEESRAQKNRRFSLFAEPFLRYVTTLGPGIIVFGEAGTQKPFLRSGVWLTF